jgi:excisionase family DNA binding protein
MQIDGARMTDPGSVAQPGTETPDMAMEPLMTADEVAAALGVHRKFVYARHRSGALRGYKLGPYFRFRRSDVEAFLEASLARPSRPAEPRRSSRLAPAGSFRALRQAGERAS